MLSKKRMILVETLRCSKCDLVKPISDFLKKKHNKSGYCGYCKSCYNKQQREYMREFREKNRKQCREYYARNREERISKVRKYQQENPEKQYAQNKINKAIKRGIIERPDNCSNPKCNNTENIEGHHEDYSKPLEVVWLCGVCHKKINRRVKTSAET